MDRFGKLAINYTKQKFIDAASARYDELQALNKLYDQEVEFVNFWRGLKKEVLEKTSGRCQRASLKNSRPWVM